LATHLTFPAGAPREQLDHVLVDGQLTARSSEAVRLPVSDHRALYVDLDLGVDPDLRVDLA
jgi:endonuclease/exonuclease/phosphatase family metal-dependent hydrolase